MAAATGRCTVFGTSGVRGSFDQVSPELAVRFGTALATVADDVVVARDGRLTGPALEPALVAGLTAGGAAVERIGRVPTHALAWAARDRGAHGVMVTASHNPPEDNGLKLFGPSGREASPDVEDAVVEALDDGAVAAGRDWGRPRDGAALDGYLDDSDGFLTEVADAATGGAEGGVGTSIAGSDGPADAGASAGGDRLVVAVDCANGVGARTTPPLLRRRGHRVVTVNAQIDGAFPGRPSKPTPMSLAGFREQVAATDADLGVAHDGDADRTVVVTGDGDVVSEDGVLAVLARDAVERHPAEAPLVLATPNASSRVDALVADAGGRVQRVPVGGLPPALADAGADLAFAAEPWKHVFPRLGPWVDGSVAAARVADLAAHAGGPEVLFGDVMAITVEKHSVRCDEEAKPAVVKRAVETLRSRLEADVDTTDGVRFDLPDGRWLLVRASGTEPLIRVYGEGDAALVEDAVGIVEDAVEVET